VTQGSEVFGWAAVSPRQRARRTGLQRIGSRSDQARRLILRRFSTKRTEGLLRRELATLGIAIRFGGSPTDGQVGSEDGIIFRRMDAEHPGVLARENPQERSGTDPAPHELSRTHLARAHVLRRTRRATVGLAKRRKPSTRSGYRWLVCRGRATSQMRGAQSAGGRATWHRRFPGSGTRRVYRSGTSSRTPFCDTAASLPRVVSLGLRRIASFRGRSVGRIPRYMGRGRLGNETWMTGGIGRRSGTNVGATGLSSVGYLGLMKEEFGAAFRFQILVRSRHPCLQ